PPSPPSGRAPYDLVGGADAVRRIVETFYDVMSAREPTLARLHECDADGRVSQPSRDRFAMFLRLWLGGPHEYLEVHGHPRLRMRHAKVPVNEAMRDAWLRCMTAALDAHGVQGEVRAFLDARF